MTRPMPGPPEHDRDTRDHGGNPDECCWVCYYVHLPDPLAAPPKRLTHVECAAHYWQAKSALGSIEAVLVSPALLKSRIRVWDRFTNTPHALEVE